MAPFDVDQGVAEGKIINTYLWHGSRQKIPILEPRQSVDTGGAAGSNQNAIYATSDPKVAIAMGLTTPGSDTGMFPNDPQMVLFSGKIRKGENVYLHKVPFNGPDGKPQFVQGGNSREFHSIPSVKEIKPIEIKEVPVNRYLNLIRKATREDWALRKKFMRKQGVREGSLNEYRDRMYQYIKSIVPGFPDYVVKDWLYANFARGATQGPGWSFDTIGKDIPKILADMGLSVNTKWQLIPNMEFTMNMWEPKTLKRLQARAGGSSKSTDPDVHIPARDAERHTTQAQLAQQQGGVRKEPVILIKTAKGYELLEGWHRTIQHFAKYPNGYTGPAYVAVAQGQQGVAEVKILSKVKGKGSEPGQLPRFGRPIAPGDETRYLGTKVADWQGREIWRDYLGGQLSYHLFDPDTRTVIVTTFGSRYKMNPRSYIIHGLYAAPGNPVRAAEFYRGLVRDLGLTLISDRKQSPGGNRVWQQLEQFPDVEVYGYDTNTDQALNFGAGDVEMYTVPSAAVAGSKEMQRVARDLRLVATARSQR